MKILINAGHFDDPATPQVEDHGAVYQGISDGKVAMQIRDIIRQQKPDWLFVPDNLNLKDSISWVNRFSQPNDLAVDIHLNANENHAIRGTEAYFKTSPYIAEIFARQVSLNLLIPNRGPRHESESSAGSLGWLNYIKCRSVIVECAYLTNPQDRDVINSASFLHLAAHGFIVAVEELMSDAEEQVPDAIEKQVNWLTEQVAKLVKMVQEYLKGRKLGSENTMEEKKAWYISSKGEGLSLTVGGLSIAGLPTAISKLVQLFGIDLDETYIGDLLSALVTSAGALIALYGLLRKGYFKVFKKV